MIRYFKSLLLKIRNSKYRRKLKDFYERRKCLIWIQKSKERLLLKTYLKYKNIPASAFPVNYEGEQTYFMGIDKKGVYAIDFNDTGSPSKALISPLDLYEARSCQGPVYEVWGFDMSLGEKIKLGIFIALIITLIIIIFLMSAHFMGA